MVGKARIFSDGAREAVFQKEFDDELYSAATQQNSYNLGSVHFSDNSGIANITQAGTDQRKANLKGALFTGNIGFDLQTVQLDVGSETINLLEDATSTALSVVSVDKIVTISAGSSADLTTILGAQRPGQRLTLYSISGNTITIKNTAAATENTILTPDGLDFTFVNTMAINLVYDITTTKWRIVGSTGGGSGGLTEPIILTVNEITPQTIPTDTIIDWSLNPNHIDLDRAVQFEFSNLPTSGKYEGVLVIIDIDGTGGFDSPLWPASVANPPVLVTTANTRYSVMLYTINGGTVVTNATSVGSSSTGGEFFGPWTANHDAGLFDLTNVGNIDFNDALSTIFGLVDLQWFQGGHQFTSVSGALNYRVDTNDKHSFFAGANNVLEIDGTASALKILGTNVINLNQSIMNTIGSLQFNRDVTFTPTSLDTIGFDFTTKALKYNVALTSDAHIFQADGEFLGAFTRVGSNSGLLTIDNVVSDVLQGTENVFLSTFTNSTPTNGQIWRDLSTGLFQFRENGITAGLGGSGANVFLSNLDTTTLVNNPINMEGELLRFDTTKTSWIEAFTSNVMQFVTGSSVRLNINNTNILASIPISMLDLNKITNVVDPTNPQDVATKNYVDGLSGGANTSLSNLIATTINQDLLPDIAAVRNLGSASFRWGNCFFGRIVWPVSTSPIAADVNIVNNNSDMMFNVSTGNTFNWVFQGGSTQMELSSAELSLPGVNLDMENNTITDANQIQLTGSSGDVVRGFFSVSAGFFDIAEDENSGVIRMFAKTAGGVSNDMVNIDGNTGIVGFGVGSIGFGSTSNRPTITRVSNDLQINTVAASSIILQSGATDRVNLTGTDFNILTGTFVDWQESVSSATAGASTLPSNPTGFIKVKVSGVERRIPFYAV